MEQAAKLTVKVKLHAAQPVVLPKTAAPTRLSKLKVFLGLLLLGLLTAAGYLLWQQFVGKVPNAVAADRVPASEVSVLASEETGVSAGPDDVPGLHPTQPFNPKLSADRTPLPQNSAISQESANQEPTSAPAVTVQNMAVPHAVTPNLVTNHKAAEVSQATTVPANSTSAAAPPTNQQTPAPAAIPITNRNLPEGFSRIVLTATMEQLEPGAAIDTLVAQQQIQRLYLFTELKGYAGQQLIHRWSFADQVQTEALLTIEDSPWRTYSEKWLLPNQLGSWQVEIVDQQQKVLYQHDFQYQ